MGLQEISSFKTSKLAPESALGFGMAAAAAPLWTAYLAAASVGMTYWWATSWVRRAGQAAPELVSFQAAADVVEVPVEAAPEAAETAEEVEPVLLDAADVDLVEDAPDDAIAAVAAAFAPEPPVAPEVLLAAGPVKAPRKAKAAPKE